MKKERVWLFGLTPVEICWDSYSLHMFNKLDFSLVWWDQKGYIHFTSTMMCTKSNNLHAGPQKLHVLVFCWGQQIPMNDWEERERHEAMKYEQHTEREHNSPLDFTSVICLHKCSKKYRDKTSKGARRGTWYTSLKPNSSNFMSSVCSLHQYTARVIPDCWRSWEESKHKSLSQCCSSAGSSEPEARAVTSDPQTPRQ